MNNSEGAGMTAIALDCMARWAVYKRLQELAIPCICRYGQALQVSVQTPTDLLQVWSVIRQVTVPRYTSVHYLQRCWEKPLSYRLNKDVF